MRNPARQAPSPRHGLFSVGGLVGAACAGLLIWLGASPLQHVVGTTVIALLLVGGSLASLVPDRADAGSSAPAFARPTGRLRTLGLFAFAALLIEGAMARLREWNGRRRALRARTRLSGETAPTLAHRSRRTL